MSKYALFIVVSAILAFNSGFNEKCIALENSKNQVIIAQKPAIIVLENKKILTLSRTNLNGRTAKVGDDFSAITEEDLVMSGKIILPSQSIICGKITQIKQPARFSKNGVIIVRANQIQTPQGQVMPVEDQNIRYSIIAPHAKTYKERALERIPITTASTGTSIPLSQATDLNGGIVYAISTGAAVLAGAVTGALNPDYGRTRAESSAARAFNATPFGIIAFMGRKGQDAQINTGDPLILNLNKESLTKIQNIADQCVSSK